MEDQIKDLLQEAQFYYQSGAWQQAIGHYESILNQSSSPLLCGQVFSAIGAIYESQGRPDTAVYNYEQAFECYLQAEPKMSVEERHQMAGLGNNLGNALSAIGQFKKAEVYFRAAITRYKSLCETDSGTFKPYLALTFFNRAQAAGRGEDQYNWRKSIKEAVALYEELVAEKAVFQPYLGNALASLADSYTNEDPLMAELYWKQSISAYKAAAIADPSVQPLIAATYNNLAFAQKQERNYSKAVLSYTHALEGYQSLAVIYTAEFQPFVASTFNNLGVLFTEMGERDEAILNYQRALKEYDALETITPGAFQPYRATLFHNLGVLHDEKQSYEDALKYYKKAFEQRLELAEVNPDGFLPDLAVTALNLATLYQSQLELTADMKYRVQGKAILASAKQALSKIEQQSPTLASMQSDLAYFQDFFEQAKHEDLEATRLMRTIGLWQEEQLSTIETREKLFWQQKIVDALSAYLVQYPDNRIMEEELAQAYGHQAWLFLLDHQAVLAFQAAEKAVAFRPQDPQPYVNFGHVLLWNDQEDKAREIYLQVKDQITVDKKRVSALIMEDLKVLSGIGLPLSRLTSVREMLASQEQTV